jgi:hypothetical protein
MIALPITILTMTAMLASTSSAFAFMVPSSVELPSSTTYTSQDENDLVVGTAGDAGDGATATTTAPWRVSLNLGREFATPLWESFGTSGIRFPVVVPCSFSSDGSVSPTTDTVSYVADVKGGVSKPVEGGNWKMQDAKKLEFSLEFPEELCKKDVLIPAGSKLVMEGVIYPQAELKKINDAFSQARVEEWKALEKIDEIQAIRDAPKRWNEESQRWEHPTVDEPLSSLFSKHWTAFVKGQERRRRNQAKPRSGVELSARHGRFPGFAEDNQVYFGTSGVIRNQSKGGMVVGTWSAEPITGEPASYLQ